MKDRKLTRTMGKLLNDDVTMKLFGRKLSESIEKQTCFVCGSKANEFEDALSKKEYGISGMCQTCQNIVFEGGPYDELD